MSSFSNKLVNVASFSWYPWKNIMWFIVVMFLLLLVTDISAFYAVLARAKAEVIALKVLEIQRCASLCVMTSL